MRLAVAAATPLSPDEAYYWVWSKALAPGYLDHPPMVALFIAAGTALAGDGALGVRLLSPIAAAAGTWLLVRAAEDLLPGRRAGAVAAGLLNATLMFGVGAVTMTPDTPLLLFWTATLAAVARLLRTGRPAWWLAAGVAAGLAFDSKYTAALLAPALFVWLVTGAETRGWFARWHPWAAAALAVATAAPVIAWNAAHGWASFAKQGGRTGDFAPGRAAGYLAELAGGQIGLVTPLIFAGFALGLGAAVRRSRDPAWRLLACLVLAPAAVFVEHAAGDRVQANWPAIVYPAAAIAAAGLEARWRRWWPAAAGLGLAVTALVWLQGIAAPVAVPRAFDPTLMRLGGWDAFAADVSHRAAADKASFVADDTYGHAALLARLLPADLEVVGVDARWAFFRLPRAGLAGRTGLLVRSARRADPPDASAWARLELAGEIVRSRAGVAAETYRVWRVTGLAAPRPDEVRLPRPRGPSPGG